MKLTAPIYLPIFATSLIVGLGLAHAAKINDLSGQWKAAETKAETEQRHKAIDKAADSFPGFARGKAKDRLRKATSPVDTLDLRVEGKRVRLTAKGQTLEVEIGAPPKVVKREDDKNAKVSALEKGDKLVIKTEGEKGLRTATYALAPDGKLHVKVRMSGGRLKDPLIYSQSYVRAK